MAVIRYVRCLMAVLGAVTLVSAAPASTTSAAAPTCVTGAPAVLASDGSFPIPYYASVTPPVGDAAIASHYSLDSDWAKLHSLGGNGIANSTVNPYTAMKCQYTCNAKDGCVSFTVSSQEPCALYDALIQPADLVYSEDVKPWGAYNKLCNPPKWPYTGTGKRDGGYHDPTKRDEQTPVPSLVDQPDNCTETHVAPASSWVNYAPNADFLSTHGHYTFTNTDTSDGAGFESTHRACHKICSGFGWCKSVFISYISDVWGCTVFNVNLTYDLYVEGAEGGKNTWPYGFNQQCPV